MLVVADSSPLNFLIRLGHVDVLPTLFASVAIPPEVRRELSDPHTPEPVRAFAADPPVWLRIAVPRSGVERIPPLDPGEEAAISLARDLHADALLIDDSDGRRAAQKRGIVVVGTLGVLERAAQRSLLDLPTVVRRLEVLEFRISPRLIEESLRRDAAHRQL
jgi:predicted nucleic acid-binding protein